MASLNDLQVFNEYVYSSTTEVLRQTINLFNSATRGAIMLRPAAHQGDFSELAFFKKISGLVRRRDAYDSTPTAVSAVDIEHLLDVSVKVAAGTPPVNIPPSQYRWIQQNPAVAGAAMGQQLAVDMFADMLNSALLAGAVAISNKAALTVDKSGETTNTATQEYLLDAAALFGDQSQQIACWVMHSKSMFDLWKEALTNGTALFSYGTVNVIADPWGRIFVVTDSPSLHYTDTNEHYRILGLVPGGLYVGQNNDMESNWDTSNGYENIQRTYQAEWSFNLGVKGFVWDKANGLANPDDTDLATAAYWDSYYSDAKDAAGVCLITE
jgi:hypothetical protein